MADEPSSGSNNNRGKRPITGVRFNRLLSPFIGLVHSPPTAVISDERTDSMSRLFSNLDLFSTNVAKKRKRILRSLLFGR
jgi:hypothetical protein